MLSMAAPPRPALSCDAGPPAVLLMKEASFASMTALSVRLKPPPPYKQANMSHQLPPARPPGSLQRCHGKLQVNMTV